MLKVRTLFSGIGSPEIALRDLQMPYELVDFCEIDKYAVQSYCAVHGVDPNKNLGDVSKVWGRNLPYADLLVWGFPCTDISVAGKQAGIVEGETRSGLYYEGLRILKETKPKYSIIENVKNLVGKKFKAEFEQMLKDLDEAGYNNYWKVLNAKDYGIPQNRERVFIVSIRKDIDNGTFQFPIGFDNGLRLKDFLDDEVDEKYYISQEKTEKLIAQLKDKNSLMLDMCQAKREGHPREYTDYSPTLSARDYKEPRLINEITMPCITPDRVDKRQNGRRFKEPGDPMFTLTSQDRHGILQIGNTMPKILRAVRTEYGKEIRKAYESGEIQEKIGNMRTLEPREDGVSNTLTTVQKDNLLLEPVVAVKEATKKGYAEATVGDSINLEQPSSETRRGRVGKGVAQTLNTSCHQATLMPDYRIRKLTPKECWRLMGFKDDDFQRAVDVGVSNSQLYKQAGNSIVTNVLFYIFKNLLQAEIAAIYEENKELS